ncbi:MAG TPA: hypothetical protein VGR00_01565, partial [Thermoanaerobaculia bacterium]|nr:hypothetical protein [Thermoanaerobaculia bacterium]
MRAALAGLAIVVTTLFAPGCSLIEEPAHEGPEPLVIAARAPEAPTANSVFVPVVLSTSGAAGSFYTSEMTLTNRGATTLAITYDYVSATGAGSGRGHDDLPPGQQRVIPDAIAYLRSKGVPIPSSGNQVGTLNVSFSGLANPSDGAVTIRTTTPVPPGAPSGRAGLAYAGLLSSQLLYRTVYLCGLRESDADRTNVAVQNAGVDGVVTLRLTFTSGDASTTKGVAETALAPGEFRQYRLTDI